MSDDLTSGRLDPEIAELMGIGEAEPAAKRPEFGDLFQPEEGSQRGEAEEIDLTRKAFQPQHRTEEDPKPFFLDKNYYKKLIYDEGERGKRVHQLLSQYVSARDPKDRSMFRARLIPAFWDLAQGIAARIGTSMPTPKLLLLRYGILSPTLVSTEQRDMLSRIIWENGTGEPVHYLDEWLLKVAQGAVNPSATDEVKQARQSEDQKLRNAVEKRRGQRQAEFTLLQNKLGQMEDFEANLQSYVRTILRHDVRQDYKLKDAYTAEQKAAFSDIATVLRHLSNLDRDLRAIYGRLEEMDQELRDLEEKSGDGGGSFVDRGVVAGEFNSIRQMAKLCVGRQGNHLPVLMKQYFRPNMREICTRENVINAMARVEQLDSGLFERSYKGQTNRIVPHVLLLANYGEAGVCWEPFERFNRASSRGRMALPLYPKDVESAVVAALADLRWQVAKEKAQHYWMEEGITGRYYQWFQESKLRGDVRESFINDYVLWITKESQGTQKLDREVRGIFWRNIPFPQEVKDNLRNRGFVYNELYKKDLNIARSDGY